MQTESVCWSDWQGSRLTKLTLVTGFPDAISIEIQHAPNIETLPMRDLIVRTRMLTMTRNQSKDVVATMHPPRSNTIVPTRSNSSTSVTSYRCSGKGHTAKDYQKCGIYCYQYSKVWHSVQYCSGNSPGDETSAPAFFP